MQYSTSICICAVYIGVNTFIYPAEGRAPEAAAAGGNNELAVSPEYLLRAQFHVTGLSCASCVNKVERHLKKKSGMYTLNSLRQPSTFLCVLYICLLCYW